MHASRAICSTVTMVVLSGYFGVMLSSAGAAGSAGSSGGTSEGRTSEDTTASIHDALKHANEANAAGEKGDAAALKKHAQKALDKAKDAQRGGHNERINEGVYALGEALEHSDHVKDATMHVKRAIMKFSQAAGVQIPEGIPSGESLGRAGDGRKGG